MGPQPDHTHQGNVVTFVEKGGPAEDAGVQPGFRLHTLNHRVIPDTLTDEELAVISHGLTRPLSMGFKPVIPNGDDFITYTDNAGTDLSRAPSPASRAGSPVTEGPS